MKRPSPPPPYAPDPKFTYSTVSTHIILYSILYNTSPLARAENPEEILFVYAFSYPDIFFPPPQDSQRKSNIPVTGRSFEIMAAKYHNNAKHHKER